MTLHDDLVVAALAYAEHGFSVVPVRADGSKAPAGLWTFYQTTPATPDELKGMLAGRNYDGIGIITGAVSGNAEMLELEGRACTEGFLERFAGQLDGDLWHRVSTGHVEATPSGGLHFLYRVDGEPVSGSVKLARRPSTPDEIEAWRTRQRAQIAEEAAEPDADPAQIERRLHALERITDPAQVPQVLIETRGEGGFTVCAPSAGRSHPSGTAWQLLAGGPASVPTITSAEREALHAAARALDAMPEKETTWTTTTSATGQSTGATSGSRSSTATKSSATTAARPGDDYNERASWADILVPHGWRRCGTTRNGGIEWTRPGKDPRQGPSATTGVAEDGDRLYVFTTSTIFEDHVPYTKFAAYALLEHGGRHDLAAAQLRRDGYGDKSPDGSIFGPGRAETFVNWKGSTCPSPPPSTSPCRSPERSASATGDTPSSSVTGGTPSPPGPSRSAPASSASSTTSTPTLTPTPTTADAPSTTTPSSTSTLTTSADPSGSPTSTDTDTWPTTAGIAGTASSTSQPSDAATASSGRTEAWTSGAASTDAAAGTAPTTPTHSTAHVTDPARPSASPSGSASGSSPTDDQPRTSWWPRDLAGILAGVDDEPAPCQLARQDGHRLFYAGKVNGLIGESESGKTWIALAAALQALQVGERVLVLDFEDTAPGIVSRMRTLRATDKHMAGFSYIGPDESLHAAAMGDLQATLADLEPSIVVLDGVNAAMTLLGLKIEDNTDATRFAQQLLKPIAATGACVIYVDHLPKHAENRGKGAIGAQAKRAMTTGCALAVEVVTAFGRGTTGRLKLTVDKDRPGHVRGVSGGAKNAGTFVLESSGKAYVEAPDMRTDREIDRERDVEKWGKIMEAVSRELESALLDSTDGELSQRRLEALVPFNREDVREAARRLVKASCATVRDGARGSLLYRSTKPYRVSTSVFR